MQQQDEETLRNALQEVKQIKAELEKMRSEYEKEQIKYEKEKKLNILAMILSAIFSGIVCPLILQVIEGFFTNHKWPLVIQIVYSNQSIPIVYSVIGYTCTFLVIYQVLHHIMRPFECTCGATYIFYDNYRKHAQKHVLQEREQRDSLSRFQTKSQT